MRCVNLRRCILLGLTMLISSIVDNGNRRLRVASLREHLECLERVTSYAFCSAPTVVNLQRLICVCMWSTLTPSEARRLTLGSQYAVLICRSWRIFKSAWTVG